MSNIPYFKANPIGEGAWEIMYNFTDKEHVRCYLIEGRDYALVIDTMNGYGHLRAFCETLTSKHMKLANTHFHFDHTAGNFEFDSCYIHHRDIKYFYDSRVATPEQAAERVKAEAFDEYKDLVEPADMCAYRDMKVYPIYDGDEFDLGDRKILVVEVGGHSPGSVVFIDPVLRICFSGDACNGNTLLGFGNALPIEEYLKNLLYFKKFQPMFDIMYGGHQVMDPVTIDEGIELCAKVIAGTDDKEIRTGLFGRPTTYGAKHADEGFGRADGKSFNLSYDPERIMGEADKKQVISLKPASMF